MANTPCPRCLGFGRVADAKCSACSGSGVERGVVPFNLVKPRRARYQHFKKPPVVVEAKFTGGKVIYG